MLLTLTRWLFVASLLSRFGATVFLRVVISDISPGIERRCRRVAESSIVVAHIAGFVWLLVEAGAMAEKHARRDVAHPDRPLGTWFGNVSFAQAIAPPEPTALALFPMAQARK
jgi:putative copper export protein